MLCDKLKHCSMKKYIPLLMVVVIVILVNSLSFELTFKSKISQAKSQLMQLLAHPRPCTSDEDNFGDQKRSKDFILSFGTSRCSDQPQDDRDKLPFEITQIGTSSNKEIGTYMLGPNTSCGDVLMLGERGTFKVKRVRFLYKFNGRKYIIFKKKIDAKLVHSSPELSRGTMVDVDSLNLYPDEILQ